MDSMAGFDSWSSCRIIIILLVLGPGCVTRSLLHAVVVVESVVREKIVFPPAFPHTISTENRFTIFPLPLAISHTIGVGVHFVTLPCPCSSSWRLHCECGDRGSTRQRHTRQGENSITWSFS